jgi:hypothetical protein
VSTAVRNLLMWAGWGESGRIEWVGGGAAKPIEEGVQQEAWRVDWLDGDDVCTSPGERNLGLRLNCMSSNAVRRRTGMLLGEREKI